MAADWVHPEVRNLASDLEDAELASIGKECYRLYKLDRDSRKEWEAKHALWLRLYYQTDRPVNPPYQQYGSEESIPILAEACTQFQARAFRAMFPNRNFLKAIPVGKESADSVERAKRVSYHMAWQLLVQDQKYKKKKDQLLLSLPLHGSVFTKVYFDPIKSRNVVENVRALDLVVPYGVGPRDIDELERKTQLIRLSVNKTKILAKNGFFVSECKPYSIGRDDGITEADRVHDSAHGVSQPAAAGRDIEDALILEQHTLLDLDDDGIAEPYIVWLDASDQSVKRIAIRYETDELGNPTDNKAPVEYFTHWVYMDNPDGFYGLGMGHLLSQQNVSANKLLRQFIDAGMLANVGNHSGFISGQLGGLNDEDLTLELGKFKKLPGTAEDIKRAMFQFQFPGPHASLLEALHLILGRSDRLATVTESLTGQTDKVMQPTTVMALIEQGLQVFSTVYERLNEAWGTELMKLFHLNYKHMDPSEYFSVLDETGVWQQNQTGRDDYKPDLRIMPIADPKMVTEQQKLAKAQVEWQFLSQNMLVMNSPQHYYNASRRYLEKISTENVDEVMPNPAGMARVDDPRMENMAVTAMAPMMPMAFPDQDHATHIQVHMALYQMPQLGGLAKSMLRNHIDAHQRFASGSAGQAGSQGLAQASGDAAGPGPGSQPLSGGSVEAGSPGQGPLPGAGSAGSGRFPAQPAGAH